MRIDDRAPGVLIEARWAQNPVLPDSGVPLFVGHLPSTDRSAEGTPLADWRSFVQRYGAAAAASSLGRSVRGYFANGGGPCFVSSGMGKDGVELVEALEASLTIEGIDLVCVPGLSTLEGHQQMIEHCAYSGERFAILDAPPGLERAPDAALSAARAHAQALAELSGAANAALYFPWIRVATMEPQDRASQLPTVVTPPSGHLAGLFSRLDREIGVHAAMANTTLEGALDLTAIVGEPGGSILNPLRSTRRRGIVPWGTRTLSSDPLWTWIGNRRLVLTVTRHARTLLEQLSFEVNDITAWMRIHRLLGSYLSTLFHAGALAGNGAEEAYFIKCDDENNPMSLRQQGQLVVEVGIAPTRPLEYIVLRILRSADRTIITGASATDALV